MGKKKNTLKKNNQNQNTESNKGKGGWNIKDGNISDESDVDYSDDDNGMSSKSNTKVNDGKQVVIMKVLKNMLQQINTANKDDTKGKKKAKYKTNDIEESDSSNSMNFSKKAMMAEQNLTNQIYGEIPKYDGEGDIQKLMDFIDKVENYLEMVEFPALTEVKAVTSKLIGTASLL
jgi:hypothetical protein